MAKLDDEIRLDAQPARVVDRIKVTEPGEDGDSWKLEEIETEAGERYLIEIDGGEITLYRPTRPPRPGAVAWEPEIQVSRRSEGDETDVMVGYCEGEAQDGGCYMALGDEVWVMEDYVVRYGPGDAWAARSRTPARELACWTVDDTPPAGGLGAAAWVVVGLLLLWGVVDTFFVGAGFGWGWGILGALLMIFGALSHAGRTTLVLGGAYAAWLLTSVFAPDLLRPLGVPPGQAVQLWALLLLLLFGLLAVATHRLFYVVGDGTAAAGLSCAVVYTLVLLGISCFDEDLSWLGSWRWYFQALPYRYVWLAAWLGWLIYFYRDYRRVPLGRRGFFALRDRVVRLLQQDPLGRARAIGDGADDLADALHLSDDPRVRELKPYRAQLYLVARIFRGAGKAPGLERWQEQIRADAALLAEELAEIKPGGPGLRVSPVLDLATGYNSQSGWWLGRGE
jgi:hypothetical protein